MTTPYDHDSLFLKAKVFINRAMDETDARPFEEQALWASLALELLAKAALARVSPLLIAEPTEDGNNLLIAAGLLDGEARFISVRAKTLYSRCQRAFRPFKEEKAQQITAARNEYLHGSKPGFTNIPPNAWWPQFWAQADVLVNALERRMSDLVGEDRVAVVEGHLAQNAKNIEDRSKMLVERARQRLAQHRAGSLSARVASEWSPGHDRSAGMIYSDIEKCPACGEDGFLEGEEPVDSRHRYEEAGPDGIEIWLEVTVTSEHFGCSNCGLVLDDAALINAANLRTAFEAEASEEEVGDYYEGEYGND